MRAGWPTDVRVFFRPLLVPTLWCVPAFALLIGLGAWQIERLHWKLGLIREMQTNMSAPPLTLDRALALGAAAQYHAVRLTGRFDNAKETFVYTTGPHGMPVYHVLTPFTLTDGRVLLIDRGMVPLALRDPKTRTAGELTGIRTVVGVWYTPSRPGPFTPRPDYAKRLWYIRDVTDMARVDHVRLAAPAVVEADAAPNPGGWPKGGQTAVDLPNNHLGYAITWFGLAIALFTIYVNYHRSRGRLSFFADAKGAEIGRK
jgi:surfeit locus 1 family protein